MMILSKGGQLLGWYWGTTPTGDLFELMEQAQVEILDPAHNCMVDWPSKSTTSQVCRFHVHRQRFQRETSRGVDGRTGRCSYRCTRPYRTGCGRTRRPSVSTDSMGARHMLKVLPMDDMGRAVSDSVLPTDMIEAGEAVLDQVARDQVDYIPGETNDWDTSMVAVAVYRAMTAAAKTR